MPYTSVLYNEFLCGRISSGASYRQFFFLTITYTVLPIDNLIFLDSFHVAQILKINAYTTMNSTSSFVNENILIIHGLSYLQ